MRFNAKVHGKIISYQSVSLKGGHQPLAECVPELKGHVSVPVETTCLVFAPAVGSIVYVDISRVALKGNVIGHVLAQATVRFEAEVLLGKFMYVSANRWRYGENGEHTLQARDVISCRVVRVGQEDESGLF
jgi:DNA-directed RNA polymerase subunit E'/Rpb7